MTHEARITAVVTIYRPMEVPPLLEQLRSQVDEIVIVDDGSGSEFAALHDQIRRTGATLLILERNSGIAAALNVGINHARSGNADAVVTFDQDSEVGSTFVSDLLAARSYAISQGAPAGPVVPALFGHVSQAGRQTRSGVVVAAHAIQSGMLITQDVLAAVGLMDESLFIDLVDTDFELRCDDAGFPCIIAPGLRLAHNLGARYRVKGLLGRLLPPLTLSTPFRYYYRARNRIIVNRRNPKYRSRLRAERLADSAYFCIAVLLARPRRSMWALIRGGIRDGRAGVDGRMPADLQALASDISWRATSVTS
ncbi:glycosyltransferase [Microbacterium sp.]|uniref:glycosyltransferase n=1 Tax=Microbacterium sp. TaxID=51671 RepID=UPI003C70F3AE